MLEMPQGQEPKLRLLRFTWEGVNFSTVIDFEEGFNLLGGSSQAGRTRLLRLIRYAMGGRNERIDDSIVRLTRWVSLDFEANGQRVSTRRSLESPEGKFAVIVAGHPPIFMTPTDMNRYMLEVLNIPFVFYPSVEGRRLVSFNDIARALVIDRDFSYSAILSQMWPTQRREVVKLMLGLTTQETADAEEEIREADRKVQELTADIRGIERMLQEFQIGSLMELEEKRAALLERLREVDAREGELRLRVQSAATQNSVDSQQQAEGYQVFREELINKREQLTSVENELAVLTRQREEKSDLRSILEGEVRKLERHTSSQYVLSSFTFSHCPRCNRPITEDMRQREDHGDCMLCSRSLEQLTEFDTESWNKSIRDARRAVQEADDLIGYYNTRIASLQRERGELEERIMYLEAELTRQTATYVSPLVEDLSLIHSQRTEILSGLSQLGIEEKQRQYANRMQMEILPQLRSDLEQLQSRLQELQTRRGRARERINAFLAHFDSFMRRVASNLYREVSWSEEEINSDQLLKINQQEFTRPMTGPDLVVTVIAFHYALLAMKVSPPSVSTSHPGLLIVDEPQQQMMSPQQYHQIMMEFIQLGLEYPDSVQIIVAATNKEDFKDYERPVLRVG